MLLGKNNSVFNARLIHVLTNCRIVIACRIRSPTETMFENDGVINRVRDSRGLIGVSDERQLIECQENRVRLEDIN